MMGLIPKEKAYWKFYFKNKCNVKYKQLKITKMSMAATISLAQTNCQTWYVVDCRPVTGLRSMI